MNLRPVIRLASIIIALIAVMPGMAAGEEESLFVDRYFKFLRNGQLLQVLSLLEEPLHSQRKPLLQDNPAYVEFIINRYRTLRVEILGVEALDDQHSAVDLALYLKEDAPPLLTRFTLRRCEDSWKLLSETTGR